ncbi:DUF883 family protein [Pseudomonas citronellolis]|uniref:DUF883 family protein n=1 Tax=Pseudomonas citronellolis TaxID=53408 RepID=UPI0023E36D4D|nr:hypothetical protein [Pseudomonas citronellolis]MDF3934463.1 hypothetical protein [Pseudomonas citronellolis]
MSQSRWSLGRRPSGLEELQSLVADLESLLESSRELAADEVPAFKARLRRLTSDGRDASERLAYRSRQALRAGGEYVGEHPWQVGLILAASAGLLAAACLLARQR